MKLFLFVLHEQEHDDGEPAVTGENELDVGEAGAASSPASDDLALRVALYGLVIQSHIDKVWFTGVLLKIKVGINCRGLSGEGVSALPLGEGSEEGALPEPSPQENCCLLALRMVSFGAFWVIFFLQFSCLFTTYANIMPVYVTASDKPSE